MSVRKSSRHTIDFLFPAALFLVFAVCALCIMLLAANIYRQAAVDTAQNDVSRTALSYISEKMHQSDTSDGIQTGTFDGQEALILRQTIGTEQYTTYIYLYGQELKELFIKDGVQAQASAGKTILSLQNFSIQEIKDGLFSFTCTDTDGKSASTAVWVHSTAYAK